MLEDVLAAGASWTGESALTGDSASVVHANKKAQISRKRIIGNTPICTIHMGNLARLEEMKAKRLEGAW
jgi:hypothetical protein